MVAPVIDSPSALDLVVETGSGFARLVSEFLSAVVCGIASFAGRDCFPAFCAVGLVSLLEEDRVAAAVVGGDAFDTLAEDRALVVGVCLVGLTFEPFSAVAVGAVFWEGFVGSALTLGSACFASLRR